MAVLHVYAVIDADRPLPDRTGVAGGELTAVRSGPLAAVVGPAEPDPTEDDKIKK